MLKRYLVAVAAALAVAIPALAQMAPIQMTRPLILPPKIDQIKPNTQYQPLMVDPANDPERARALIKKLQADKKAMRNKMQQQLAEVQRLTQTIDEMTRVGGSLVRAQCVSPTLSRTTSGVEEDCTASGYMCGGTEGTCLRSCSNSSQCAAGYVCDTGPGHCVVPPPPSDESCDSFWDFC